MNRLEKIKEITKLNLSDNLILSIIFEMGRYFDKQFTTEIKKIQKENNIVIDSPTRKILRKKFYFGDYCNIDVPYTISKYIYTSEDINKVIDDCYHRLITYDSAKITESMKRKADDLQSPQSPTPLWCGDQGNKKYLTYKYI